MTKTSNNSSEFENDFESELPDDMATEEVYEEVSPQKKKSTSKKPPRSPLTTRGKSPVGNWVFAIIIFIVVAAGLGYFVIEEFLPANHLEELVTGDTASQKEAVDYFSGMSEKKWFDNRIQSLIAHPREVSQRFGCRALTELAIHLDTQDRQSAVEKLEKILMTRLTPDSVQTEILRDLKVLAEADSESGAVSVLVTAIQTARQDGQGLIRENRHYALQQLDQLASPPVEKAMIELTDNLNDSVGQDLQITLYEMLGTRLVAGTQNLQDPHNTSGQKWEHQANLHDSLIKGYLYHEDQRVRRHCWEACQKLSNPRGLQLWFRLLEEEDLTKRILAITLLRRFSGQFFDYDPYNPNSDSGSWENWINAANP